MNKFIQIIIKIHKLIKKNVFKNIVFLILNKLYFIFYYYNLISIDKK